MKRTFHLFHCVAATTVFSASLVFSGGVLAGGIHHDDAHLFGTPCNQEEAFGCEPRCNPLNHVRYLQEYFPYFYDIVTQNSPKSNANRDLNFKGIMAFSGLVNMDLRYTNRDGSFTTLGSNYGAAVRPFFRQHDQNYIGNINNANLFVDTAINNWVLGHFDLAYVNASPKTRTYNHYEEDTGSVYRSAAAFKVNQMYLLFSNPACTPVYVKVGKFNEPFGDYKAFDMVESFTQLLTETRTGGVQVGAAFCNGLYGSVQWTMSEQSLENRTWNAFGAENAIALDNKDRNWGAKVGFRRTFDDTWHVHVNGSYICDMRDVNYLLECVNDYNVRLRFLHDRVDHLMRGYYIRLRKAAGLSLHGNVDYCGYGLSVDYVKALSGLNNDQVAQPNSMIGAWNITAYAHFKPFCCPARVELSYQSAFDPDIYDIFAAPDIGIPSLRRDPNVPFPRGAVLPCDRISIAYEMQVMPYVGIGLQWVHDHDWDEKHYGGTGDSSDMAVFRITAEF